MKGESWRLRSPLRTKGPAMNIFGDYKLRNLRDQPAGTLFLFPHDNAICVGFNAIQDIGHNRTAEVLVLLGKVGDSASPTVLRGDDLPARVLDIDRVASLVPDLLDSTPVNWEDGRSGVLYLGGDKRFLTVAFAKTRHLIELNSGEYVPGTFPTTEWPVTTWSVVLDQPSGHIELLRHESSTEPQMLILGGGARVHA
jgi:hypothetical protein